MRRAVAEGREAVQDAAVATWGIIGSAGFPFDEPLVRDVAGRAYDRGLDADGSARQLAACLTQPDRTHALGALAAPTLVIHGLDDPLISPTGGLALARAIPRARFVGYHGLGHDLPRDLWSELAHLIATHARKGAARGTGGALRGY
jgi:pimeloyl-ACP methyl ester carboxylesterase